MARFRHRLRTDGGSTCMLSLRPLNRSVFASCGQGGSYDLDLGGGWASPWRRGVRSGLHATV